MSASVHYEFDAASQSAAAFYASVAMSISDVGISKLREGATVGAYLDELIVSGQHLDALQLMAFALPTRRSLWWACLCLLESVDANALSAEEKAALKAVVRYVIVPSEVHRSNAERASNRVPFEKPLYQLARAAGYADYPLPAPQFAKKQDFRARGVFGALWIALSVAEAKKPDSGAEPWLEYLAIGIDVSRGQRLWPNSL